jgi:hypothetical protein
LADRTNGDELLLRTAIKGRIVTSSVFPLVWIDDRPLRGVEYLRILTPAQIEALCDTELQIVGASLRDLVYLHTTHSKASLPDCLDDVEDVIKTAGKALSSRPEYLFEVQGLLVAPWPTKTHSLLRWIPTAITGDYASEELFVGNKVDHTMAFCDPQDLSYHNIENVIPLDNMFRSLTLEEIKKFSCFE